jgi:hypothetical protein
MRSHIRIHVHMPIHLDPSFTRSSLPSTAPHRRPFAIQSIPVPVSTVGRNQFCFLVLVRSSRPGGTGKCMVSLEQPNPRAPRNPLDEDLRIENHGQAAVAKPSTLPTEVQRYGGQALRRAIQIQSLTPAREGGHKVDAFNSVRIAPTAPGQITVLVGGPGC